MNTNEKILKALPYGKNFSFVDAILEVDDKKIKGCYTYKKDMFFYDSHFVGNPLVPGVIMIETMGQIGMVSHLIYLTNDYTFNFLPVLSNVEASFFGNAEYGECCYVTGTKIYFRKNILRSSVEMRKADGSPVAALTANIMVNLKK